MDTIHDGRGKYDTERHLDDARAGPTPVDNPMSAVRKFGGMGELAG